MSRAQSRLSAAQISARQNNGRHGKGPLTPETKAVSALNSVKHGLCSHAAVLPGESLEEFQATLDGWVHDLKPVDAFEREVVYHMVCATIAVQRVRKADNAAVSARIRDVGNAWDDARALSLKALVEDIHSNTMESHAVLLRRADGCRWLIERWKELDAILAGGGSWDFKQRDLAIRLLGVHSGQMADPTVRHVHGLGMALEARLGLEETRRAGLKAHFGLDVLDDPDPRAALREIVADELEALESLLPALEVSDKAERESAIGASAVDTSDDGVRRHRYLQDHLRNFRQLSATLLASRRARRAPRQPLADVPPTPAPKPAEPPARNEPKNDTSHAPEILSVEIPAPAPHRLVSKLLAALAPRPASGRLGVV